MMTNDVRRRAHNQRFSHLMLRKILETSDHPLGFLVHPVTKSWYAVRHGSEHPSVQIGHAESFHAGGPERLFLEDADFNQLSSWKGERHGVVFVENRRTGLALGKDCEDRRTAGEDERFSRFAEGLRHNRHGVTVLGEALRRPLNLSDAGGADGGVYLSCWRGQARGIGEVAGDGCKTCGLQLRGRGAGPRQSHDLMALLQQLSGDGTPDKSGCAGDKDLHIASRRMTLRVFGKYMDPPDGPLHPVIF